MPSSCRSSRSVFPAKRFPSEIRGSRSSRLAYEPLRGTGTAADVLVCTSGWFDRRRELKASLQGSFNYLTRLSAVTS